METLYLIRSVADPNIHRIGRTHNWEKRKRQHKVPEKMTEVHTIELESAYKAEKSMLKKFDEYLLPGQGYMVNASESELIQFMDTIKHEQIAGRFHNEKVKPKTRTRAKKKSEPVAQWGLWKQKKDKSGWYRNYKVEDGFRVKKLTNEQFEEMRAQAEAKEKEKIAVKTKSKAKPYDQSGWIEHLYEGVEIWPEDKPKPAPVATPNKVNPVQLFWMAIAVVVVLKLLMGCTNASEATKIEQQQNQQCLDYFQARHGVHYAREQCQ